MMRRLGAMLGVITGGAVMMAMVTATPALAHEERTVGRYQFAVGFGDEPAYAGMKNSVQMFLHDADDKPVTDLGDTLKVDVGFGGQTMTLSMEPFFEIGEFGIPGDYRAWFIPTRPGTYSFHFTGSIKGQKIDQTFTSGPTTFSDVEDPSSVEFPAKDPSVGQVAQKADRLSARVDAATAAAAETKDAASTAKTIGYVGIAVGAMGLVIAVIALVSDRRARTRSSETAATPTVSRT
jgi:hypothetical protein